MFSKNKSLLQKKLAAQEKYLEELKNYIEIIDEMITNEQYSTEIEPLIKIKSTNKSKTKLKKGISETVLEILGSKPNKWWKPSEVYNLLKKRNLETSSEDLPNVTRSTLQNLAKSKLNKVERKPRSKGRGYVYKIITIDKKRDGAYLMG